MKKIAVIGSGISGHVAAYRLKDHAHVTLYEAEHRFGGHANTVEAIGENHKPVAIDTGFIVYNELTYPGLTKLFEDLNAVTTATDMSFGCQDERTGLQYSTKNINGMFAQRQNLLSLKYLGIWADFFKFRRYAKNFAQENPSDSSTTLSELVKDAGCGRDFWEKFLYPMGGAIWSTAPEEMNDYPARSFLNFMINHRMLDPAGQPIWRTVVGGSRQYVHAIAEQGGFRRWSGSPVTSLVREEEGVKVVAHSKPTEVYDEVIVATHSNQALKMIAQPTKAEREILSRITYQANTAVLHSDESLMPSEKRAWAAWNVHLGKETTPKVELTYDMNRLQHLDGGRWLVTLNPKREIQPKKVFQTIAYEHPFFDLSALKAQDRWQEISGVDRIHYCGAYWRWGFHEDGLWSAMRVVDQILENKGLSNRA